MKASSVFLARGSTRDSGVALVVVLSLVALLLGLILAFMLTASTNGNRSVADVAIRQAETIAELAKSTVIADLVGEMKAGATSLSVTPDQKNSFSVQTPASMRPERAVKAAVLADPRLALLFKQSANNVPFHNAALNPPAGSARASNVSTATPAMDGRKVAETRWSAPVFFEPALNLQTGQVPDWIYTARNGTNPTTDNNARANATSLTATGAPNPDYVVGRYAYQVYDVSGLLDINVAGYGNAAPALDVSRKGSLLWADLKVLPGATTNISKVVDWRHPAGGANALQALVKTWGEPYGWMRTPVVGGQSDNLFLGRNDLIAYQKANPALLPAALLPFLTTASRELNQPSWAPTIDAGTGFQYKTNQDLPTAVNRRFTGVRVLSPFTRRDGTTAVVGEPLILTRFPLSKLKAFEAPQNLADIALYFGLTPVNGTGGSTWLYRNSTNVTVLRLDQVAAANREPDFFEMLKAGLLEGSIANPMLQDSLFTDTGRDNKSSYQILRIGASIIDQWDANDDPTIIQYGVANPLTGVRVDDVAGVENLPYFHFLGESRFRRRDLAPEPNDSKAATFITFQLWNPHKNVADGRVAAGSFRIAFAGQSHMTWFTLRAQDYTDPDPVYNRSYEVKSPVRTAAFATDYIGFNVDAANSFSQPIYLKPTVARATSAQPIDTIAGASMPVIGYNVGEVNAPYTSAALHNQRYGQHGLFSNYNVPMTFALQKNIGGVWVNYQVIPNWSQTHGYVVSVLPGDTNALVATRGNHVQLHAMFIDPRTTRYGLSSTTGGSLAINKTTGPLRYTHLFWPPAAWTSPGGRIPEQYESNPKIGSPSVIVNRDGIRRPADAGAPFTVPSQRPEILNRPFQSVADMGLAFRDDPWTSLNLFGDPDDPSNPGDGALLDLFSLTEKPIRAGVVNPNAAPAAVLEALLSGAAIREGAALPSQKAKDYALAIRAELDAQPLLNPAGIAALAGKVTTSIPVDSNIGVTGVVNHKDRQVITRALADPANTRTWNLLVDVIAQSGKLPPSATSLATFIRSGERRFWYHIAIDRFTGEIVDIQRETIFE